MKVEYATRAVEQDEVRESAESRKADGQAAAPVPGLDPSRLGTAQPAVPERDRYAISSRVERALRQSALWDEVKDRLDESGLSLSGGQQQRLCIARAIAVEPDVVLLDEPASSLDPIATSSIEDLMHELKRDYTFVIVTHNMQQAARVADMTAFFSLSQPDERGDRSGVLVEYDATQKIFTSPAEQRTEDYVTGRFG